MITYLFNYEDCDNCVLIVKNICYRKHFNETLTNCCVNQVITANAHLKSIKKRVQTIRSSSSDEIAKRYLKEVIRIDNLLRKYLC